MEVVPTTKHVYEDQSRNTDHISLACTQVFTRNNRSEAQFQITSKESKW